MLCHDHEYKSFLDLHVHFKGFVCLCMRKLHAKCQIPADAHNWCQIVFSLNVPKFIPKYWTTKTLSQFLGWSVRTLAQYRKQEKMAMFTQLSFCQKLFCHQTSSAKRSVCLYCVSKVSDCFSKSYGTSWFPPHMHYLYIIKMHQELQREITLTEMAFSPFYSNTNVHLVYINVFAKFDEIPSLPVQYYGKTKTSWTKNYKGQ